MLRAELACYYKIPEEILDRIRDELDELENSRIDDCTIARYYIASKCKIATAVKLIRGYIGWRSEIERRIPKCLEGGVPLLISVRGLGGIPDGNYDGDAKGVPEEFRKFWRYVGGGALHKTDKSGTPIYIDRIGLCDVRPLMKNVDATTVCDWHVSAMEFMVNRVFKECEKEFKRPVTKHITIMDCAGLGVKHMNLSGFQIIKRISETDALYYPERLLRLYIVNTTPFFVKVWNLVRNWIDRDILDKICVGRNLYDMVDKDTIPPENLPIYLGGTCSCPQSLGGCVPTPNDVITARARDRGT